MGTKIHRNIVHRYEGNPVFAILDMPFSVSDVHNAGCVRTDGQYHLLITVEHLEGDCAIYRARSDDGRRFEIDPTPMLSAADGDASPVYECQGVRDARVTRFGDLYYILYLAQSEHGVRLGLARSDMRGEVERMGLISQPDTKGGALFPEPIHGAYARLERPREGGNIWISYSDDLVHWGGWRIVMTPRHGYWDHHRIGTAAPPIATDRGWLLIYYGARVTPGGSLYRLGAAYLNREDPTQVIGRSNIPILAPRERYERLGDVPNIVFSCGAVLSEDGEALEIYYGAADSCVCLGTVALSELEKSCFGPGE